MIKKSCVQIIVQNIKEGKKIVEAQLYPSKQNQKVNWMKKRIPNFQQLIMTLVWPQTLREKSFTLAIITVV